MLDFLEGDIVKIGKDYIILNNGGIGYFIQTPAMSIGCFSNSDTLPYKDVTVYTHLKISEDSIALYGFHSETERELFRLLLSVNKVGPKAGISVLSYLSSEDLVKAILENNYMLISKTPGIGVKTAQKIILELKDKIPEYFVSHTASEEVQEDRESGFDTDEIEDTVAALVSLGYSLSEAKKSVKKVLENKEFKGLLLNEVLRNL